MANEQKHGLRRANADPSDEKKGAKRVEAEPEDEDADENVQPMIDTDFGVDSSFARSRQATCWMFFGRLLSWLAALFGGSNHGIDPGFRGIKFRFGQYDSILKPGLHAVVPLVDNVVEVDVRPKEVVGKASSLYSNDGMALTLSYSVTLQISDVVRYHVGMDNGVLEDSKGGTALTRHVESLLRDVVRTRTTEQVLQLDQKTVNASVRDPLAEHSIRWGVKVLDLRVHDIDPPEEFQRALAVRAISVQASRAQVESARSEAEAMALAGGRDVYLRLKQIHAMSELAKSPNGKVVVLDSGSGGHGPAVAAAAAAHA